MKLKTIRALTATALALFVIALLFVAAPTLSAQPPPAKTKVPPSQQEKSKVPPWVSQYVRGGISISIDGTEPADIWENQDFVVKYTVFNNTDRTIDGAVNGKFQSDNLVPLGSAAIHLPPGQSAAGSLQTHIYYGPLAGVYRVYVAYTGGGIHCVPQWPSGQICIASDSANANADVTIKSVGDTLVSLDPLPQQALATGALCDNSTYPSVNAPDEWVTIPNGFDVPVSGRVVNYKLPDGDLAWDHPFGFDYWLNLLPDAAYWDLLNDTDIAAKSDCTATGFASGKGDGDLCAAFQILENDRQRAGEGYKGLAGIGALHTEMEDRLVPSAYRAFTGDRVYMRGRRIIDCGHNNFTAELHPPTVFAKAAKDQTTGNVSSTLLVLPYRTVQTYKSANLNFIGQLAGELAAVATVPAPVPLKFFPNISNLPADQAFVAHYRVSIATVKGRSLVGLRYHFVVRPGVHVTVSRVNTYQADVQVSFDPASYSPPSSPICSTKTLTFEDADKQAGLRQGFLRGIVNGLMPIWVGLIPNPMIAASLDLGLATSDCNVPNAAPRAPGSVLDNQVAVDSTQSFPAYGWVDLNWTTIPTPTDVHRPN